MSLFSETSTNKIAPPPITFGLIVPRPNVTMEPELVGWFPEGSRPNVRRIPSPPPGDTAPEGTPEYAALVLSLAETLDADVDRVVFGCTAGGFLAGAKREDALVEGLTRITGKPSVSTARAVVDALTNSGAKRIGILSPYTAEKNQGLDVYLSGFGIDVAKLTVASKADIGEYGKIRAQDVMELAVNAMSTECEALFIACSHIPTFSIIAALQEELGRPVFSSISATAWKVMCGLGLQISYEARNRA